MLTLFWVFEFLQGTPDEKYFLPFALSINYNIKGTTHFSSEYAFLKFSAAGDSSIILPTKQTKISFFREL